jgi:hypothetical protein
MNRTRGMLVLMAVLVGGAATALGGQFMSSYYNKSTEPPDGIHWGVRYAPEVPTVYGPYGQPIPVAAPYNVAPPTGEAAARAMLAQSMPLDMLQQAGYLNNGSSAPIQQVAGPCPGGACPAPPGMPNMPPGMNISPPGGAAMPPGVGGMAPGGLPPGLRPPGAVAAVGALTGAPPGAFPIARTEVRFVGPPGMKITWYGPTADGRGGFGPQFLEAPARYNFLQASIYRLKLSSIPNRPGIELYPTLEVVPAKAKTCTFLAHSAVPVSFTEEDFEQVAAGNFVVKVIYLPDPQFQDLASTGPDEVVSSRLEPGVDPIVEAQRRGSILLVVRLGNIDLEAPNTPAMDAPNPFQPYCPPGAPNLPPLPPGMGPMVGGPGQQQGQMPPAMANRQPMMPPQGYGQAPYQGIPMSRPTNPNMQMPGPMMPQAPGGPGTYPTNRPYPPNPQGNPALPLSQASPPPSIQAVQYQQATPGMQQVLPPIRRPSPSDMSGQVPAVGSMPGPR